MRDIKHYLSKSKTGKSAILKIEHDDMFGKKTVNFSSVKGWRKDLALKYLSFESKEWNDDGIRIYIGLQVLKCSTDRFEAIKFISVVKLLSGLEVNFWANKLLTNNKTKNGWRSFYG